MRESTQALTLTIKLYSITPPPQPPTPLNCSTPHDSVNKNHHAVLKTTNRSNPCLSQHSTPASVIHENPPRDSTFQFLLMYIDEPHRLPVCMHSKSKINRTGLQPAPAQGQSSSIERRNRPAHTGNGGSDQKNARWKERRAGSEVSYVLSNRALTAVVVQR
jgi:hypothetical protein